MIPVFPRHLSRVALPLVLASTGCTSSVAPQTSPAAEAVTSTDARRIGADGSFARYLVTPRGDVDGVLLVDGTVARFRPHDPAAEPLPVLTGADTLHLEGVAVASADGQPRTLVAARVSRGSDVLVDDAAAITPPPDPAVARRPRAADGLLAPMQLTARVQALLTGPDGRVDGLVTDDGTSARGGRGVLTTLGLVKGEEVTLTGRGGSYALGKSMDLESIKVNGGAVVMLPAPPPPPGVANHVGTIARVLLNPHGDADGLLLTDGTFVRFPPRQSASALRIGASVLANGEGTGTFVHADTITLEPGGSLDLASPPPPPAAPPAPLPVVSVQSPLSQALAGPDGRPELLLLKNGAIVALPPPVRDQLADPLAPGAAISASGEGGTYGGVPSLRADRLQVGSGPVVTAPAPPAPVAP